MKRYVYKILRSLICNFVLGSTSKGLSAKTIEREVMGLDRNKILQYIWKHGQSQYKQKCLVNESLQECSLTPGNTLESNGA